MGWTIEVWDQTPAGVKRALEERRDTDGAFTAGQLVEPEPTAAARKANRALADKGIEAALVLVGALKGRRVRQVQVTGHVGKPDELPDHVTVTVTR